MSEMLGAIPVLAAVDMKANVDFWVEALGFTREFETDGFAGLTRDAARVYVSSTPDQLVPDNTMAWVMVRDLDALHAEWAERVPPEDATHPKPAMTPPHDTPWGSREVTVRDPAGNCVHFVDIPG